MIAALLVGVLLGVVLCRLLVFEVGQACLPNRTKINRSLYDLRLHNRRIRPRNDGVPFYCWRFNLRVMASGWWSRHVTRDPAEGPQSGLHDAHDDPSPSFVHECTADVHGICPDCGHPNMDRIRELLAPSQPSSCRWFWRLHAFLLGYFWLPCPVCGREFSGWEWGRDGHTVYSGSTGHGVCSARCAAEATDG